MFHQLHCLDLLRSAVYGDTAAHVHIKKREAGDKMEHLDHCFQYLAQVRNLAACCSYGLPGLAVNF
jgi:hypothetical protein